METSKTKKHLVYTVAFDALDSVSCRTLAKFLAASLLRTYFEGDILVFRNTSHPLFLVERAGLEEIYLGSDVSENIAGAEYAWSMKYGVRDAVQQWITDNGGEEAFDKVLFLDADSIVLRSIEHLLEGNWDIAYQPERGSALKDSQFNGFLTEEDIERFGHRSGVNSGSMAVSAKCYHKVMEDWSIIDKSREERNIGCRDQASWNKLLLETTLKKKPFERYEIQFPLYYDSSFESYKEAAILHTVGANTIDKIRFTFGMYMNTFFCDQSAFLLNVLDH